MNNSLFNEHGISIPGAILASTYIIYLIKIILNFDKENFSQVSKFIIFGIFIFSLLSLDRYSGYGNDAAGLIFVCLMIILMIKNANLKYTNDIDYFKLIFCKF